MSFPNLSSRTSKLMYPSFQDDFDQAHWDSHPQDEDANYEQLYKRVPGQSSSNKMFSQEKRGLSYIDKSIALCTPSDPASLNNKLQKFFKTLTKNYKPVTPRSTNKSPRGTHLTNRQEEGYSPSKYMQNKGSPLVMRKLNSRSQKSFSQGIIENERPLSTNEDDEELIMARENMYGNLVPQQEDRYNEVRDYRQYGNSIPMNSSSMRSLSNPARQSQEEKIMMELGGRNMPRMSNVSTQDQSMLPCFNQSPMVVEDNCNYAYLKSYQNDSEGPHPYQRFLVQEEDPNVDLRGHNPVYIPRKNGPRETVSQSQSSSLKKLDTNQHQLNANYSKKASKTSDLRKKEVYSSQGSPLINYHFSERDDEFEPYRPSIAMPGVAGVYSSMLSESKDENPNYTDVKLIAGAQAMSHNEIRNEQMLSFAKKSVTNFGNTLQQSSEDNKLRTMSQVTDLMDSTEDMFIKQKGCFNMFLALNKIVFKRINSVFQDIKRGPLQFQEVSHGNFVSFGEAIKYESNGLNRVLARHQSENGQGLNMILQGFAKISGMVNAIEIASSRTKQSAFEKIANYGTISQVVYKDRFITGFLLLFAIEKSQRRSTLSQSFNTWATTFKMDKLREAETFKYQQIIQIISQEKQKLQEELDTAKEKKAAAAASPVVKANPSQKDLKFFLQSMEAPGGPLKLRKDSNDSKPSSTNTTTTTRQEEVPVRASWGEPLPLASRVQATNKVSEDMDPIKMFNGAIKKAFEQDSTKKARSKPMFGHEFANSAQKNVQENQNNRYVDTRRNEPENCFSPPQNYIDTLKKQSKGNYESILSPSSQQNYYESRGIEHESNKGSRGDINMKNHLGKGLVGFGVSPPKELTEEDEFTAESMRKGGMGQLGQREFFESLERFDHANVDDAYSSGVYHEQKSSMTMDLSEIMRERTGDMKSIRDIARGMIPRNFDESMMGSEGEQSFYKQGMENVMILKREGI